MDEPTVLDYLKSIFKSWEAFANFVKALFERRDPTQLAEFRGAAPEQAAAVEPASATQTQKRDWFAGFRNIPWLVLGALFFALLGQLQFEPPQTLYPMGIFFYFIALMLTALAFARRQWSIAELPESETRRDSFVIRSSPFVVSLVFSALTFFFMSKDRFTAFNVTLWVLTLAFHLLAFWAAEPRREVRAFNPFAWLTQSEWKFTVTRHGLLVFFVFALAAFFAFYKLSAIPDNMTSDHAEKLLDVYDISQGKYSIFFPRNTGREPLQFYFVYFLSQWFGISFLSLKVSTGLMGMLSMFYIYKLAEELGGKRVALLAVAFAGIGVWPVLIDRIGLRFAYYPPFTAATLYYFIRGLRQQRRNDFILSGIALGIGLNGYTPMRIVPFVMVALFIIYLLHVKDAQIRKQALVWFALLAFTAWIFIIPLTRYALEFPDKFNQRALSRISSSEQQIAGPVAIILAQNIWNGLKVFNWYGGTIWTFTLTSRAAMDFISGALFLIGVSVVLFRYLRQRRWQDLMLLLAIPLLQLPSTLSIAFPEENPALNRMSAAFVPTFIIVAFAVDAILSSLTKGVNRDSTTEALAPSPMRSFLALIVVCGLFFGAVFNNYNLIFNQYVKQFELSNWNTRDMGLLMKDFAEKGGSPDQAWVVPYPYWADTRLPLFWAGTIYRGESALKPDLLASTVGLSGPKLFIINLEDQATLNTLQSLYPTGALTVYQAKVPSKNFYVFRVAAP
ncbi:MAG: glycosyltransferase family 39 protein [Anaerolineales bacterium]|nr:glycosyltransferase family 39 protein [Anaerolineales bacterium]